MKISVVQTVAFFVIILFSGFYGARAESPGQPGSNSIAAEEQTLTTELSGTQLDTCRTVMTDESSWIDRVHALVKEKTCEPVVWFDNFFGEDHVLLDLRPGTFIVLRNTARLTEGLKVAYASDFSISFDLPRWERLLRHARLYIDSRSEIDRYTAQPGQPIQPGINQETGVRQPIIGVRIDPYIKSLASLVSIDSGVRINMQPNAFVRMRYQYSKSFGGVYLIRFSEIAMWRAVEHFSNALQFDLERNLNTFTLVRWGNSINYIDDTPGIKWNTGISYFTLLTRKSAITFDTNMWGVNDPEWTIENYRIGSLYRLNFYRPWLFFEIEPEVTWPVYEKSGHRNATYALMSTLEIQIGK